MGAAATVRLNAPYGAPCFLTQINWQTLQRLVIMS